MPQTNLFIILSGNGLREEKDDTMNELHVDIYKRQDLAYVFWNGNYVFWINVLHIIDPNGEYDYQLLCWSNLYSSNVNINQIKQCSMNCCVCICVLYSAVCWRTVCVSKRQRVREKEGRGRWIECWIEYNSTIYNSTHNTM